ncbi:MAG: InlB B-repeat-containing protein, partial [Clostridiales bacterium]|nr:InlB B-repeat-containing protein [Clostridiales bacterium]
LSRKEGTEDIWEATFSVDDKMPSGVWEIYYIWAIDGNSNSLNLYNSAYTSNSPNADLSGYNISVAEMFMITFDSRGGSEVETQYVLPGEKATVPENPTKGGGAWQDGGDFEGWYTDEALTEIFNFNTPINENITLYAKWYYGFSVCSYDKTNDTYLSGGQLKVEHLYVMDDYSYGGSNYTLLEGTVTLSARPDPRYAFKGWYKGEYIGGDEQISRPLDMEDPENLLSTDREYTFYLDKGMIICPVFEVCTDHDFGPDQTIKATTTAEGRVYHVCKNCGTEVTIKVLPKLKLATPTEKITISKKPSIKKPTAAKGKITVKWKHFKHTSKKTQKIWKKIKKVQVQCATDNAFKNIVKTTPVKKSKTSAKIKGLKKKTTYYVRVRYFDGVGYSKWSKVKKVKTK